MGMRNFGIIFLREFKSYFTTAYGYLFMAFYLGFTMFMFIRGLLVQFPKNALEATLNAEMAMRSAFDGFFLIALFITPILTMKSIAEEKKNGTIELVYTSPIGNISFVLGKYFAAVAMYLIAMVLTLSFPFFLNMYAVSADVGANTLSGIDNLIIVSQYIALFLLGAALLAVGIFTSSISKEPYVALLAAIAIGLIMWFSSFYGMIAEEGAEPNLLQLLIIHWTLLPHTADFLQGKLYFKHILFYFLWIGFFLSLSTYAIGSHKWK